MLLRTITPPLKDLRFLLGIGKLLSDRIPPFPSLTNIFIYHRTHNLVYIQHPQDFLPMRVLLHKLVIYVLCRIVGESPKRGLEEKYVELQ